MPLTKAKSGVIADGSITSSKLDVGRSDGTGAAKLPTGTTAQRPTTPTDGMIRKNTTTSALEFYDTNGGWTSINTWLDSQPMGDFSQVVGYGFENNLLDYSGAYNATSSNMTYSSGYYGQAATFNGSNSVVNYPTSLVVSGNSARSISLWSFITSGATGRQLLVGTGIHGTTNAAFDFEANSYSAGSISTNYGIHWWGNGQKFSGNSGVIYNQWVHLVVTHSGGNLSAATRLYINGAYVGDLSAINQTFSTSGATVHQSGYRTLYSDMPLNGKIDQYRLFNRVLTDAEINKIFTTGR